MRATKNFLVNNHPSINLSRSTDTLRADVYHRKSEGKIGWTNALFSGHQLWRGRHKARLQLRIFIYETITSQNHTIALNAIVSWKVRKSLVEIQQAGMIILVLTLSSQLTLRDNIATNEIHVGCIEVYDSARSDSISPILQTRIRYFHRANLIYSEKSDLIKSHQSQHMGIKDLTVGSSSFGPEIKDISW